jgi:hypothetical protein
LARCAVGLGAGVALMTSQAFAADDLGIAAFSAAAPGAPPPAWKFATLPKKTPTKYTIVELDGTRVLKVEADDSYGNLAHVVHLHPGPSATIAWRWRVDKLVEDADLKVRSGDDAPAKLCVFFAFDASLLSLGERTRLSIAQSTTGQEVPTETLCYVWDNKLPVDSSLVNAFTKRIRMIVLQSGTGKLGQWVPQKRSLVADYQRMFSDESGGKVPEIVGVAISADADNTHEKGLAYFGDITLEP